MLFKFYSGVKSPFPEAFDGPRVKMHRQWSSWKSMNVWALMWAMTGKFKTTIPLLDKLKVARSILSTIQVCVSNDSPNFPSGRLRNGAIKGKQNFTHINGMRRNCEQIDIIVSFTWGNSYCLRRETWRKHTNHIGERERLNFNPLIPTGQRDILISKESW